MTSVHSLTPSMWLRHASGAELVSAKTAEEMVRMIVGDECGQTELDRNEPLSTSDEGNTWLVSGSMSKAAPDPPEPGWAGPISVRISKFDGQIIDYMHTLLPE